MPNEKDVLSISEMAKLHKISRQTLIHYDKIDLFKPEITHQNGYRYYSLNQIPVLREITFLRSLNIPLEDIKQHLENRTPESAMDFYAGQIEQLDQQLEELKRQKQYLRSRQNTYKQYYEYQICKEQPELRYFPRRKLVFIPYANVNSRGPLHDTLMRAWRLITDADCLPAYGFGTIIRYKSLSQENIMEGAGSYIVLPEDADELMTANTLLLPAGDYITMYKYGMPYNPKPLVLLLEWMSEHEYSPCGDVADACIFDASFYTDRIREDFCQLQVPIRYD
ncbi:MAG: MerR family transcriptional regulator [Lachnospiraceae bacterium]